MEMAQILMVITLIFMVWGKTPLYLTAIVGSTIAALAAGFPISGKADITLAKLINGGLNPVIADITGVLMFVGILETSGFLKVIINKIISWGSKLGGAPGITAAGSLAAGCIGALTGFTQPVVTAAITGPVATKLGMDPNKTAGLAAHAGHFGNFAGFTHPTQVAVVATAAIGFGAINVVGAITGISIIAFSWYRIVREMRKNPPIISQDVKDEVAKSLSNKSGINFSLAIFPFLLFCIGFVFGIPVFVDGTVCAILVAILAKMNPSKSETDMINGVKRASIPIVATISFLLMDLQSKCNSS